MVSGRPCRSSGCLVIMSWLRRVFGCLLEAVGFALDCDDLGVMDEATDQGGDAGRGGEDLAPCGERTNAGYQGALVLVTARDELEQQIGMAVRVGDLVDDQECRVDAVAQPTSQL